MFVVDDQIEKYAFDHTRPEPALLSELSRETQERMDLPQMLTGRLEGRFLKLMVQLIGAKRVLEVGTFTGYSALSMAEGLPEDGELITCELDPKSRDMALRFFEKSPHGKKISLRFGPALETIRKLEGEFDMVFVDADKENYPAYFEETLPLVRSNGLLLFDNTLWSGRVLDPQDPETHAICELNSLLTGDERVESVLLTVRDGIQMVRKR